VLSRRFLAGICGLTAAGALAAAPGPADAAAPSQCFTKPGRPTNQHFCPLNRPGPITVYAGPSLDKRVGYLTAGGSANWFLDQVRGEEVTDARGFSNVWWAYTRADVSVKRGKPAPMGYIPEIWFRGGGTVTRDPALGLPVRQASGQRPD
jgi:hypothetical protein